MSPWNYRGDHFAGHTNIESLHCTPETIIMLCQSYLNEKKNESGLKPLWLPTASKRTSKILSLCAPVNPRFPNAQSFPLRMVWLESPSYQGTPIPPSPERRAPLALPVAPPLVHCGPLDCPPRWRLHGSDVSLLTPHADDCTGLCRAMSTSAGNAR